MTLIIFPLRAKRSITSKIIKIYYKNSHHWTIHRAVQALPGGGRDVRHSDVGGGRLRSDGNPGRARGGHVRRALPGVAPLRWATSLALDLPAHAAPALLPLPLSPGRAAWAGVDYYGLNDYLHNYKASASASQLALTFIKKPGFDWRESLGFISSVI